MQSKSQEQIILDWAKNHYHHYKDISTFPFEEHRNGKSKITAGLVYLCLKKHSFIQQNETTEYRVMCAYFKHNGRLADMARETGLKLWVIAKTVEKLGYPPKWQDYRESRYLNNSNLGISGEALFKRLVPEAVDANEDILECNPIFDFIINDKTVDVKEYAPIKCHSSISSYYVFRPLHTSEEDLADFYCLFLCKDREKRLGGEYHCLLIPKQALKIGKRRYQISTNPNNESYQFWMQFEVEPCALASMFDEF